jgi:hypothetical protein
LFIFSLFINVQMREKILLRLIKIVEIWRLICI